MNEIDILGFDPKQLRIFEEKEKKQNLSVFNNINLHKNYPVEDYLSDDFDKPRNNIEVVIWVYNQMLNNSKAAEKWLRGAQYDVISDKNNKAHDNKCYQVLDLDFYTIIFSKMNSIIQLAKNFEEKCQVYEIPLDYYKKLKQSFVNYLTRGEFNYSENNLILTFQLNMFVEGIFKHIMSAEWDYDHLRYILEDQPYTKTYIFNGKWTKISK